MPSQACVPGRRCRGVPGQACPPSSSGVVVRRGPLSGCSPAVVAPSRQAGVHGVIEAVVPGRSCAPSRVGGHSRQGVAPATWHAVGVVTDTRRGPAGGRENAAGMARHIATRPNGGEAAGKTRHGSHGTLWKRAWRRAAPGQGAAAHAARRNGGSRPGEDAAVASPACGRARTSTSTAPGRGCNDSREP